MVALRQSGWLSTYRRLNSFWLDVWAIAVAALLPWSSSASSVLIAIWLFAMVTSVDANVIRHTRITAVGALPVLLWLLAAVGMLWAEVSWVERFDGLRAFHKLVLIPLVMVQYARSDKAWMVPATYLVSCAAVLSLSFLFTLWPELTWHWSTQSGVPVRDTIAQGGEFILCAFAALAVMIEAWQRNLRFAAFALGILAVLFLFNVVLVATSRTALVTVPILALVLGLRWGGWRGGLAAIVGFVVLAGVAWLASPHLRSRVTAVRSELNLYEIQADTVGGGRTSAGERIEYWRKSLRFVSEAPIIGHGTGSIVDLFRQSARGKTGFGALATANPHNQTLAVAIELGLVGVIVLWAMWVAHFLLFCRPGLANMLGLLIVTQNIVSSAFNSHLSDFTQGWTYVFGVGVFGGMALRGILRYPSDGVDTQGAMRS